MEVEGRNGGLSGGSATPPRGVSAHPSADPSEGSSGGLRGPLEARQSLCLTVFPKSKKIKKNENILPVLEKYVSLHIQSVYPEYIGLLCSELKINKL